MSIPSERPQTYSAREVMALLGVSLRTAERTCRPYRVGLAESRAGGRVVWLQRYAAEPVLEIARRRSENRCQVCGAPARATAYTCGANACACKAWRKRREAYRQARAAA